MKAYRIKCDTTDTSGTCTHGPGGGEIGLGSEPYRKCDFGIAYVVTDDPRKIYTEFPMVKTISEVGFGYKI